MVTVKINGQLEIDSARGVVYFHTTDQAAAKHIGGVTVLRICQLPAPVPTNQMLDITHMHGVSWKASANAASNANNRTQ